MFFNEEIIKIQTDLSQAEEIIEDFQPLLLSTIKKYCFYGDFDDHLQDGREKILHCILEFDGRAPFPAFLQSRLKYFYLEKIKKRKEYPQEMEFFDSLQDEGPEIIEYTLKKEEIKILGKALKTLSPNKNWY